MELSAKQLEFLETHHAASMTTLRADGSPHTVRVGVALVDGRLWSSGVQSRVRTKHVRRDPRGTVFVFDARGPSALTIEANVTILEGPELVEQSRRLFQVMQGLEASADAPIVFNGQPRSPEEFRQIMLDEGRLIYEFEPVRAYGIV